MLSQHVNSKLAGKMLRWEEQGGAGMLVYSAQLVTPDSISGTVTLRDAKPNDPNAAQGTFTLVRLKPMGRQSND
jgi:hypothetical protein